MRTGAGPRVTGKGSGDTTGVDVVTEAILYSEYQIFLRPGGRLFTIPQSDIRPTCVYTMKKQLFFAKAFENNRRRTSKILVARFLQIDT
jgi:hypothetical protein